MAYNILIVDDSVPMRAVIKKIVMASGFNVGEVFEAANGREALGIMRREWLDLVVSDYNMPEMNGLEMLREMKKDEILSSLPLIMITTERSRDRLNSFIEAGASDYIAKPFTPEEVRAKLDRIMGEENDGQGTVDENDEGLDF